MLANITIDWELIERLWPLIEDVRWAVPVDFIPNENSDYTQYLENYTPQVDASLVIFWADTVGMFTDAASKNGPNAKSIKEYLLSTTQSNPREEYNTMFSFNQSWNGTGITFKVVEIRNGEIVVLDQ